MSHHCFVQTKITDRGVVEASLKMMGLRYECDVEVPLKSGGTEKTDFVVYVGGRQFWLDMTEDGYKLEIPQDQGRFVSQRGHGLINVMSAVQKGEIGVAPEAAVETKPTASDRIRADLLSKAFESVKKETEQTAAEETPIETVMSRVRQRYAVEKVKRSCRRRGAVLVDESISDDGTIRLRVRVWS